MRFHRILRNKDSDGRSALPSLPRFFADRWIAAIFAVFVLLASPVQAETLAVPDVYGSIQEALDAAVDGDTVQVAPGFYSENLDFLGKDVALQSTDGAEVTTISGDAETLGPDYPDVITFVTGENAGAILQGFTIANGTRSGVYCDGASPLILDNIVESNAQGGIRLEDSSPVLEGNIIRGHDTFVGAALVAHGVYSIIVSDCEISGNYADLGPAGALLGDVDSLDPQSSATFAGCTITGNTAGALVGGIACLGPPLTMLDCLIKDNAAGDFGMGGVLVARESYFSGCLFENNSGEIAGALNADENLDSCEIVKCVFVGNTSDATGGAIYVSAGMEVYDSEMSIDRCTFVGNSATTGAVIGMGNAFFPGEMEFQFTNCILWGNLGTLFEPSDGEVLIDYSDVAGGYGGTGNIDEDPLFVDAEGGNYRLTADSPCIDTGDPDGSLDPDDTVADMGAFFYPQQGFLRGDVNGNEVTEPLIDSLALLSWQFAAGATPPCMDAADIDDNGVVNALVDALSLLFYGFAGGVAPADPGPSTCGLDSSEDTVECGQFMECP